MSTGRKAKIVGIAITKIDDKAEGFTVAFTESNAYVQRFPPRPNHMEAVKYANLCIEDMIKSERIAPEPPPLEINPARIKPVEVPTLETAPAPQPEVWADPVPEAIPPEKIPEPEE